jgi:hypothetical protein
MTFVGHNIEFIRQGLVYNFQPIKTIFLTESVGLPVTCSYIKFRIHGMILQVLFSE